MARFKVTRDETGKHTWKATGVNPKTGREMIIRGGQAGTPVGKNNPASERSFDARHDATGMTPKKYINKLRWDNKAKNNAFVNIPNELFGKTTAVKKSATKRTAVKAGVKKRAAKKARKTSTRKK